MFYIIMTGHDLGKNKNFNALLQKCLKLESLVTENVHRVM